jgi:hypothetical protein
MATRSEHLSLPNSGPPCAWKSYRWIRRLSRAGGPFLPRAAEILVPLTEKLREVEGLPLCRESVRRIRQSVALPAKHPRRAPRHRRRRLPEARAASLVLLDGSPAAWLEDRGPTMTLHGALDNASGAVLALFLFHNALSDHIEGPAYLSHTRVDCPGLGTEPHAPHLCALDDSKRNIVAGIELPGATEAER